MRRSTLVLVVAAALCASSCCLGGPFAPRRRLAAHGRVLRDDGSPAPGIQVALCANDGLAVRDQSEPRTCLQGVTDANGAYALEVGNVAPEGGDCLLDVTDESGDGLVQRRFRPPAGTDDPMRIEVSDVRLSSPGSHDELDDVTLSVEGTTVLACAPRALHRCVLYAGDEGHVRVWPPTDLDPGAPCEGQLTRFPGGGSEARRAGVFVASDALAIDRLDPHDGLLLQCTEGRAELTP